MQNKDADKFTSPTLSKVLSALVYPRNIKGAHESSNREKRPSVCPAWAEIFTSAGGKSIRGGRNARAPFFAPAAPTGLHQLTDKDTHVHCDDDADGWLGVQQPAVLVVSGRNHRPAPDGLQGASDAAARSWATRRAAGWGRVGRWVGGGGGWRSRHNADAARTTTKLTEGISPPHRLYTGRKVSRVFGNSSPSRHW